MYVIRPYCAFIIYLKVAVVIFFHFKQGPPCFFAHYETTVTFLRRRASATEATAAVCEAPYGQNITTEKIFHSPHILKFLQQATLNQPLMEKYSEGI